ncbi:MAG: AraC family transcriptional regulator [Myxococcaceae bacterium]|nr:AraC family transcriptional regulator [Myxococcaceae bacterium]
MGRRATDLDFTFRLVPLVLRLLEARGVLSATRQRLLAGLPEDAAGATAITVPLRAIQTFLDGADLAAREPCLGLSISAAVPRGTYSWIEFIARLSTTLKDGMSAVSRYYRLLNKGADISYVERGDLAGLEVKVHGRSDGWGRHLNEYTVALFHRVTRELMPQWAPTRVWFAHPAPPWPVIEALSSYFGVTPQFDQPTSGLEGPRELVERPLATGDATLQRLLEAQANDVLAQQVPLAQVASRVREVICRRLGKDEVSVEAVAPTLAMSPRTLQRRLSEEGLSFQDVLDGAREQFSKGYLNNPALSMAEIAYLLGYSELRAFDRAFRRWTGQTPTEWRTPARR